VSGTPEPAVWPSPTVFLAKHADGAFALVRDRLLATGPTVDFEYIDWLYGYRCPS
jgi:hypothetical protein